MLICLHVVFGCFYAIHTTVELNGCNTDLVCGLQSLRYFLLPFTEVCWPVLETNHSPVSLSGESHGRGAWQAMVHSVAQSQTWLKHSMALDTLLHLKISGHEVGCFLSSGNSISHSICPEQPSFIFYTASSLAFRSQIKWQTSSWNWKEVFPIYNPHPQPYLNPSWYFCKWPQLSGTYVFV